MITDASFYQNWTQSEFDELHHIGSFAESLNLAKRIIDRIGRPLVQVCGPLSSGGRGSFEANVEVLCRAIRIVAERNLVFDQRPFQIPFLKLREIAMSRGHDDRMDLLEAFYLPLFKSGKIVQLYFVPAWYTSIGTRWEWEQGKLLNIRRIVLENHLFCEGA
jgi:hypothetical protein